MPPIFAAAIPVEAVTAISRCFSLHQVMISRRRTDFPVPAEPVKKTLLPCLTRAKTRFWSVESFTSSAGTVSEMEGARKYSTRRVRRCYVRCMEFVPGRATGPIFPSAFAITSISRLIVVTGRRGSTERPRAKLYGQTTRQRTYNPVSPLESTLQRPLATVIPCARPLGIY